MAYPDRQKLAQILEGAAPAGADPVAAGAPPVGEAGPPPPGGPVEQAGPPAPPPPEAQGTEVVPPPAAPEGGSDELTPEQQAMLQQEIALAARRRLMGAG